MLNGGPIGPPFCFSRARRREAPRTDRPRMVFERICAGRAGRLGPP